MNYFLEVKETYSFRYIDSPKNEKHIRDLIKLNSLKYFTNEKNTL